MVNAQEWLDREYPFSTRRMIKELDINYEGLEGSISLRGFDNLKVLKCGNNEITNLDVSYSSKLSFLYCPYNKISKLNIEGCSQLTRIDLGFNSLQEIDLSSINKEKLISLQLHNNELSLRDLSFFSSFVNLQELRIGNEEPRRKLNHFYGSLKYLGKLRNLNFLDIQATDISEGLEYLPNSMGTMWCGSRGREESKSKKICEKLGSYYIREIDSSLGARDIRAWRKDHPELVQKFQEIKENEEELTNLIDGSWKEKESSFFFSLPQISENISYLITEQQYVITSAIGAFSYLVYRKFYRNKKKQEGNTISTKKIKNSETDFKDKSEELKNIFLEEETLLIYNDSANLIRIIDDLTEQKSTKPTLERLLGKGGYGEVYYGKWKLQEVAIKKLYLSLDSISERETNNIKKEIEIIQTLRNRYVIQYYDTYSDEKDFLIIMDYAENGTLTKFINDHENQVQDWNLNVKFIKQMVLGLAYIHHEGIIHRDLKSLNILLTDNNDVKISDFGLSKVKIISSSTHSKQNPLGTMRWMAPENIKGQKYSEQSDIYSLGMIIWEISAQCTVPFKDLDQTGVLIKLFKKGKETIPTDTPTQIKEIIRKCWIDEPNQRISLKRILELIENKKTEINSSELINIREMISEQGKLETKMEIPPK